jgi:formylglycine-generating enzyme required for sulfatase activity
MAQNPPGKVFKDCPDCPEMVTLSADSGDFALGQTEVTQGQWQAIMGNNPSRFSQCGADCPVEQVSWDDAQVFIRRLNAKTGQTYRLPTEQEWLYACLAGSQTEYCGGNDLNAVGWYDDNSGKTTHSAKGKQANAFGRYDMSGNVWEWTDTCYNGDCAHRVQRGGSWNDDSASARAAYRYWDPASFRDDNFGFRLARTAP